MLGIDLNKNVTYKYSSLRFFDENEHHVTRHCEDDVLLLVYDGVLKFTEDGTEYEVYPGQYHIQKHYSYQEGKAPSELPKYLYVHFLGEWTSSSDALLKNGSFDINALKPLMHELDEMSGDYYTMVEKSAKFFEILSLLYRQNTEVTLPRQIAEFISNNYLKNLTLEMIANEFHFSKNHIINIFKKEYGVTPFEYINTLKIHQAEKLLEATSKTADTIANECGFNDYSHFYKAFLKINAVAPIEWRNKKRINPLYNKRVSLKNNFCV